MKKYKITEEQFNEFIDSEGSLIKGTLNPTDNEIKTNQYKDSGRPQTTDDFAGETGQDSKWHWQYGGFSFSESEVKDMLKTMIKEGIIKEELPQSEESDNNTIPDISQLSQSYQQQQLQANLEEVIRRVTQLSLEEMQQKDVKAIVLKEILSTISITELHEEHRKEILNKINTMTNG